MSKKPTTELSPEEFYAQLKKQKSQPKATIIAGVLLLVFLALVFFVMPPQLPWLVQKLVGVVNAILAMLLVVFGVKEYGKKHETIQLPLLKKVSTGAVGGGVLFALVMAWWLSPFAPIRVGMPGADEVARLLGTEMTLAVLVMPETTYAIIDPPTPPASAARMAQQISGDADAFSLLVKAIAERRYIEASGLADQAEQSGVDAVKLATARGQLAVFSGRFADAPALFAKAVEAGGDANVLCQHAVSQALLGDVRGAYSTASRLLDGARSGEITGNDALGVSLNLKAAVALMSGRFKEALTLTEESQLTWEAGADGPHKAASRNNQAVVYAMLPKKYAGAKTLLDGAINIWSDLYGVESAHVASSRQNLGVLSIAELQFAESEERLNRAIALGRQSFGARSANLFSSLNALARLNTLLGRYAVARRFADESQECLSQLPTLELVAAATQGALLAGEGNYRDASGSFNKALTIGKQVAESNHVFLADIRSQKAAVNSLQGRFGETITECESVIQTFDEQFGKDHPLAGRTFNTLGWEYVRRTKKTEARQQFAEAQRIVAANRNEMEVSPETGRSLAGLAQLFAKRQWRDALDSLRQAVANDVQVFAIALGEPTDVPNVEIPSTADYLFDEAMLYAANGSGSDFEKAVELFKRVIEIREKLLPPSHPDMAATYSGYASLLSKMDRKQEAEAMEKKEEQARESATRKKAA